MRVIQCMLLLKMSKKGKLIYTPNQWVTLIRYAKIKSKPYILFSKCLIVILKFQIISALKTEFKRKKNID